METELLDPTTFGELIDQGALEIGDGYRAKNSELDGDGPIFLRAGHVRDTHIDFEGVERFRKELEPRLRAKMSEPGDTIVTTKGNSTGRTAFVSRSMPRFVYSPHLSFWRSKDPDRVEGGFLRYWSRGPEFAEQLAGMKASTDMAPYLSLIDQKRLRISLPSIEKQRAIARILGALDDKIELNRRMSETLEAMARALFKSWFVDFDPVRAKAEGRDPGLPQPLADLFPDSFDDSDLGEIPKGWDVSALGDFLSQRVDRCLASPDTAARPYVPIECISPRSLFLRESRPGEEAQSSLTKFYKGDLLFGAMRPYFHKVCIAPFDGTTRTTAFVLYPPQPDDFAFATLQLHHPETIDFATRHSTGSTIPYAVWTDSLNTLPVIAPPVEVRKAFNRLMQPVLLRIPEPYFENRSLAALRDSLLPKLISGELRLKSVT